MARRRELVKEFLLKVERFATTWAKGSPERIGLFARGLECLESGRDRVPGETCPRSGWSLEALRADCLYEIGLIHAAEGDPEVARDFLKRALALERESKELQRQIGAPDVNPM